MLVPWITRCARRFTAVGLNRRITRHLPTAHRPGFSLVELVIVIVIIGIIAGIAVTRIGGTREAAAESALRTDLAALSRAVQLYWAEHEALPKVGDFEEQITKYSDQSGAWSDTPDSAHIYGPYLRAIPALSVYGEGTLGGKAGDREVAATDAVGVGWIYDENSGKITPNTGVAVDRAGTEYTSY